MGHLNASGAGTVALVTGARGFVGAHLSAALLRAGARVVGLDVAPVDAGLEGGLEPVCGSVTDPDLLQQLFSTHAFSDVFHLAGQATVGAAVTDPLGTFETNIRGTYLLLEHCRALWDQGNGPLRGVVTAGTERVYGTHHAPPHAEDTPLEGLSTYDASKVAADVITRAYAATYGLPTAVARCANIYGPGDASLSRIIPGTITRVLKGERPHILSDGTPERDYVYVDDVVGAYLALTAQCGEDAVRGQAFNVGTGAPVSVLALVREICSACGRPDLEPEVLGTPLGRPDRQFSTVEKAARLLGWTPRTPRHEGLRRTVDWYRDHLARASVEPT